MKQNLEFEKSDLRVDNDIHMENGQQIVAYLETLFDVNKKFKLQLEAEAGEWVNMYGIYNPYSDYLTVECVISRDDKCDSFFYEPTNAEAELIKEMITEKIKAEYNQTPKEFCECALWQNGEEVFVYENHGRCSEKELAERWKQIRAYMNIHGYDFSGSSTISLPMSMAGEHFQEMIDYCESRGISKILVTNNRDIANDENGLRRVLNRLCGKGFTVEVVSEGIAYAPHEQTQAVPEETDEEMQLGGQV